MSETDTLDRLLEIWPHEIADKKYSTVARQADALDLPDLVWLLEHLEVQDRAIVFRLLSKSTAHDVFERFDDGTRAELFSGLRDDQIVHLFEDLDPDDRVQMMDELPANVAHRLLSGLSGKERRLTAPMLGYEKGSVGRRMSPEYVSLRPDQKISDALAHVRKSGKDAETIYALPVTDNSKKLQGIVSMRDIFLADPESEVGSVMSDPISVDASTNEERAARRALDAQVLAVPIVDSEERLLGLLTVDDAVRIVEDADQEDAARAGATESIDKPYLATPINKLVRSRVVWLFLLAISATLTVAVLGYFESDLSKVVALAAFIPLLIGTGGNTGSQAAVTLTRALAVGDVRPKDIGRVLFKEFRIGFTLGAVLGILAFGAIYIVSLFAHALHLDVSFDMQLGAVVGISMCAICTISASVGGIIPCVAKSLKIDPAVMSTPFIATFCDATGLLIYFIVAKTILGI